jgi:chemotaxis methyl-accepting protein methylase
MIEDDLLAVNDSRLCQAFDVIRAANILNVIYFSAEVIGRMLATLNGRLKEGGLLIIVRTDANGENNGSIFRSSNNRFCLVDRIGNGSEIEAMVGKCQ